MLILLSIKKYVSTNSFVFKRDKLLTDFKTLVKPDEDYDLAKNKGLYHLHSDFNVGILMNM